MCSSFLRTLFISCALLGLYHCDMVYKATKFGKKYYVNTEELDLFNANDSCTFFGGSLVKIAIEAENKFLADNVLDYDRREIFWINAIKLESSQRFTRLDDTNMWLSKVFVRKVREGECVGITAIYSDDDVLWLDSLCDSKYQSICEVNEEKAELTSAEALKASQAKQADLLEAISSSVSLIEEKINGTEATLTQLSDKFDSQFASMDERMSEILSRQIALQRKVDELFDSVSASAARMARIRGVV